MDDSFTQYAARLRDFIRRHSTDLPGVGGEGMPSDREFAELARTLFALQFRGNAPFRAFCLSRGVTPEARPDWRDLPALPTAAFKELELSCLPPDGRSTVFHSSGTTGQNRSRHWHSAESLELYEASIRPWFRRHLLGDLDPLVAAGRLGSGEGMRLLALTPPPAVAPSSSLAHMLGFVIREFGARDSTFVGTADPEGGWSLDFAGLRSALHASVAANRPLLLMGTAFNFVHLADFLTANPLGFVLPEGSRVMETGGYKGRSRELERTELHALLSRHLGIPPAGIITEYGMSELSSQAYDAVCGAGGPRQFRFPPWARACVISPENGREVAEGQTGLLRVVDLANAWSVMTVQTEDLAVRREDGFELLGRAQAAEPRGCSLMSAGTG